MNNHTKGARRDRLIIDTLQEWGTMDTEQIRLLFFPSARVAQRRLKIMASKGRLKRHREAIELPYVYYIRNYDQTRLALNWARIWILRRLKSWEILDTFDYALNVATVKNIVTGTTKTYNIMYNVTRQTWLGGNETIVVYDSDMRRREGEKRIKGTLLTIEEIREGVNNKWQQQYSQILS